MRLIGLVVLSLTALVATACGPSDPETLYVDLGCPRCHGFQLEGNRYGPALKGLGEHWLSAQTMAVYLRDPEAIAGNDARLTAQDSEYELKMQPILTHSDEDLESLAAWLLESE